MKQIVINEIIDYYKHFFDQLRSGIFTVHFRSVVFFRSESEIFKYVMTRSSTTRSSLEISRTKMIIGVYNRFGEIHDSKPINIQNQTKCNPFASKWPKVELKILPDVEVIAEIITEYCISANADPESLIFKHINASVRNFHF